MLLPIPCRLDSGRPGQFVTRIVRGSGSLSARPHLLWGGLFCCQHFTAAAESGQSATLILLIRHSRCRDWAARITWSALLFRALLRLSSGVLQLGLRQTKPARRAAMTTRTISTGRLKDIQIVFLFPADPWRGSDVEVPRIGCLKKESISGTQPRHEATTLSVSHWGGLFVASIP